MTNLRKRKHKTIPQRREIRTKPSSFFTNRSESMFITYAMRYTHTRGPHPRRGLGTRRRADSSVSAACTSSPQPRCSPAFTCLPLLTPIRGRARSTLRPPFLNASTFPNKRAPTPIRHAENSVATSVSYALWARVYGDFSIVHRQTIARFFISR